MQAKFRDLCVGDVVSFSIVRNEAVIESVLPRRNCFLRSAEEKSKTLAANVDHVFIVTSNPPLLNFIFIDRALTAAMAQNIGATIVFNKIDLGVSDEVLALLEAYQGIDIQIIFTSALSGEGMELLRQRINTPQWNLVLLTGISGVGKTSLLNRLIPDAKRRTNEVSEKTGQGKQTTTFTLAHTMPATSRPGQVEPLSVQERLVLVADSPGLQNFGLAHLNKDQVLKGFPEIENLRLGCKFSNCSHSHEAECAVIEAVDEERIASSRYLSYLHIMEALERERDLKYS